MNSLHAIKESVLDAVDIVDVISTYVECTVKKIGKHHTCKCPFHDDHDPSLKINQQKGTYRCYTCGANGDAIEFIINKLSTDFVGALRILADRYSIPWPKYNSTDPEHGERKKALNSLAHAHKLYMSTLLDNKYPQATQYLIDRGFSKDIIDLFQIGYAPDSWTFVKNQNKQEYHARLKSIGILNESNGRTYDFFRNRILFPIKDTKGRVRGFGGRILSDIKPKYLNSPESIAFQKSNLCFGLYESLQANPSPPYLYVNEGYTDVTSMFSIGEQNAVCPMGTALTDGHIELLYRYTNNLIFMFDGDKAGCQAASKAAWSILPFLDGKKDASFVTLPDQEDPDSLIKKKQVDVIDNALSNKSNVIETIFKSQLSYSITNLGGVSAKLDLLLEILELMPDNVYREATIHLYAKKMGVDEAFIKARIID